MPDTSPRLDLPYLQPSQAQKHVTHNEALQRLDGLVQLTLEARGAETPPAEPEAGAMFALGGAPLLHWAGQAGMLALWDGVAWHFIGPQTGWRGYDRATATSVVYSNGEWQDDVPDLQNLDGLGVGTASDATNKLAISSDASLFNNAGDGHQLKINKASDGDTASVLFQSGWTGHAELGLAGDTGFSIKVSGDGGTWVNALTLDPIAQRIDLAPDGTVRADLSATEFQLNVPLTGSSVQSDVLDTAVGAVLRTGAFGLGETAAPVSGENLDQIAATGSYLMTAAVVAGSTLPASGAVAGSNLLHLQQDGANAAQILSDTSSGRAFLRIRETGVWQDWHELYSQAQGSLLGSVSQTGGQPTGAVIERGGTVNGEYVRFADGTQICTYRESSTQTLSQGSVSDHIWTYPVSFASGTQNDIALSLTPERAGAANGTIPAICMATYRDDCTTQQAAFGLTNLNTTADFSYVVTAIGRWV